MLSAAIATMKAMTSYSGDEFKGSTDDNGKLDIGTGSDGVWFDLFGRAFAVLKLSTLFALSITLLAAGPVILIVIHVILRKCDKWYPLARRQHLHSEDDGEVVHFSGMRGLFRYVAALSFRDSHIQRARWQCGGVFSSFRAENTSSVNRPNAN